MLVSLYDVGFFQRLDGPVWVYNVKECALPLSAVCNRATTMCNVNKLTTRVCPAHNQHQTTLLAMLKTHRQIRRGVQQRWDKSNQRVERTLESFREKVYISCDDRCHETSMDSSGMPTVPIQWPRGRSLSPFTETPLDRDPPALPLEGKWDQEQRPPEGSMGPGSHT